MRRIILASGSPRRKELMELMGLEFECVPSEFEEKLDGNREPKEVAKELALGKALDVARKYPDALVVGSDVFVVFEGRQLGKQPDAETARCCLRKMSGKSVEVYTSVALVCHETGLRQAEVAVSTVVYAPYDDAVIDRFLATDVWRDKAGAMAIQHPLSPPIDHIEGDYDTILGLSTRLLSRLLTAQGIPCHPADLPLPKTIRKLA